MYGISSHMSNLGTYCSFEVYDIVAVLAIGDQNIHPHLNVRKKLAEAAEPQVALLLLRRDRSARC